jgi:hypothetical protein
LKAASGSTSCATVLMPAVLAKCHLAISNELEGFSSVQQLEVE